VCIKSGEPQTLNQGFFGGFPKLRKTLGDRVLAEVLSYGGTMSGERESVRFTPVGGLADTLAGLDRELS
jgi:phage major head subunit gpT-like protein